MQTNDEEITFFTKSSHQPQNKKKQCKSNRDGFIPFSVIHSLLTTLIFSL